MPQGLGSSKDKISKSEFIKSMLRINDIHKKFDQNVILEGLSFEVPAGSMVGLIGPSGCGKSTLLKIIGQVIEADSGTVELPAGTQSHISLMFQEGALFDSMTVFDNVAFPLVNGDVPTSILSEKRQAEVQDQVSYILARVGLSNAAQKVPGQLSGGMRRRLSLARALVSKPKLALLDDPTFGLDPIASSVIMNLIVELHREYRPTLIMVSHDLRRLLPVVDTIISMADGVVTFQGTVEDLRSLNKCPVKTFVSCRYDFSVTP